MTEQRPGFIAQLASYPGTFWVANTMEIFERMSWYGWFTVMALYVTGPVETGGLGFTTETRGLLMAIVPFFLYLTPVLTGAIADRYGFKKMLVIAYLVMIVAYYTLGQAHTLPTFFLAFMFVAVGAAIFKPVIVGTVAKVTNESNSATAFGIFYMMVNVGGFVGPIVAGIVRGEGWEWVFVACAAWAGVNLVIVLVFYREPATAVAGQAKRTFKSVLDGLVEVLGNLRFFITVGAVLVALMAGNILSILEVSWFSWVGCGLVCAVWIVLNFFYDLLLPAGSGLPHRGEGRRRLFLIKRMHCSNWRFALFLLIMSGFWTSFNQIFYTMPEYIRDFVDTRPFIDVAENIFGESDPNDPNVGIASKIATINELERAVVLGSIVELTQANNTSRLSYEVIRDASRELLDTKVRLTPSELREVVVGGLSEGERNIAATVSGLMIKKDAAVLTCMGEAELKTKYPEEDARQETCIERWRDDNVDLFDGAANELASAGTPMTATTLAMMASAQQGNGEAAVRTNRALITGRQFNPEFIVNINAGAIVLFQVLISFMMCRFHQFTTMIVGMVIASVGIGFSAIAGGEGMVGIGSVVWIAAGGIFIFSFGEMMASPTSQEYVGRIAPHDKKALYMGYFFVSVALGNLFGGILSGELYGKFARDMQRPDLMWLCFGGIMLGTAIVFLIYNKLALPKHAADTLMNSG